MRLFSRFCMLATGLLVVNAANTIITPALGDNVYAKDSLKITWKPDTPGPVTITLRFGAANSLAQGTTIAKGISNSGSFSWTVPEAFGSGIYTVELKDDKTSAINYSPLFSLSGGRGIQGTTLSGPGYDMPTIAGYGPSSSSSIMGAASTGKSDAKTLVARRGRIVAMVGANALALLQTF